MRLRFIARLTPEVSGLQRKDAGTRISFLPLEAIWADSRFDPSREIEFSGDPQSYNTVAEGDLLVPKVSPTFAHGRTAIARGLLGGRALATSEVFVLRPHDPTATRFLKYRLLAADFLGTGQGAWFGVAGLKRVSADFIRNVRVDEAAWANRVRIADFLDREYERIADLQAVVQTAIDMAHAEAQSHIETLLWPRPPKGQRLLDMPALGHVPEEWLVTRNKALFREVAHLSDTGAEELLSVSHIHGVTRRSDSQATMFLADSHVGYKRVQRGDLVMNTMWVWMGALGVTSLEGIVSPAYSVYRSVDDRLLAGYADLLYRSPAYVAEMTRRSTGVWSSRLRLYSDAFLAMPVAVPPVETQQSVVRAAESALGWVTRVVAQYAVLKSRLDEYRTSLVTEAVSGRLDVRRASEAMMEERAHGASEGVTV